jgi:hypothetical protein
VGIQRVLPSRVDASPGPPPPIKAGTRFALHKDLQPGQARASVVVVLSSSCQYCTASMPFYRRLAELDVVRNGQVRFGVIGLQPDPVIREYMASNGLDVRTLVHVSAGGVAVQATPTLLITDSQGAVTRSWAGRLPPADEEAVFDEIARLTSK